MNVRFTHTAKGNPAHGICIIPQRSLPCQCKFIRGGFVTKKKEKGGGVIMILVLVIAICWAISAIYPAQNARDQDFVFGIDLGSWGEMK